MLQTSTMLRCCPKSPEVNSNNQRKLVYRMELVQFCSSSPMNCRIFLHHFMPLVNSKTLDVNNQSPLTSNLLPDTNGDEELSEASIIQPVTPVTTSNAVTHHINTMPITNLLWWIQSQPSWLIPLTSSYFQFLLELENGSSNVSIQISQCCYQTPCSPAVQSLIVPPHLYSSVTTYGSTGNFSVHQTSKQRISLLF